MIAVLALVAAVQAAPVRPFGLTTEWRENPVGIDAPRPRLGWKLPSGRQAAYELEIDGVAFGKTAGEAHVNVPWPAPPPASSQRVASARLHSTYARSGAMPPLSRLASRPSV